MTLTKYTILALLVCAAVSLPVKNVDDANSYSEEAEGEDLLARLASHLKRRLARGDSDGYGASSTSADGTNAVVNVAAGSQSQHVGGVDSAFRYGDASGFGYNVGAYTNGGDLSAGGSSFIASSGIVSGSASGGASYLNLHSSGNAAAGSSVYNAQGVVSADGSAGAHGWNSVNVQWNNDGSRVTSYWSHF